MRKLRNMNDITLTKSEKGRLNGIWNAERILQEYLRMADKHGYVMGFDMSDNSPHSIEQSRFAAVMEAYGKGIDDGIGIDDVLSKNCSIDKQDELRSLLKQCVDNEHLNRRIDDSGFIKGSGDVHELFSALFRYRKSLYEVENVWSGMLECPASVSLVVKATRKLYEKHIKAVSDTIDRMLVLLMDDDFDRVFTEEELLTYGYPDVSDDELEKMILDNL